MTLKDESNTGVIFHCYDCGGVWDKDGVDIYQTKDLTKYICKECRGRCLPKDELTKVKGIKSIRQRFGNSKVTLLILIVIFVFVVFNVYNRRVIVNDFNDYIRETVALRTVINSKLETYREDYKIFLNKNKGNFKAEDVKEAQNRIVLARKYISAWDFQIENIKKPETPEVIELYDIETNFWKNPSYTNYISYQGKLNELKRKYGSDFLEIIKNTVRKRSEKKINNK